MVLTSTFLTAVVVPPKVHRDMNSSRSSVEPSCSTSSLHGNKGAMGSFIKKDAYID